MQDILPADPGIVPDSVENVIQSSLLFLQMVKLWSCNVTCISLGELVHLLSASVSQQ